MGNKHRSKPTASKKRTSGYSAQGTSVTKATIAAESVEARNWNGKLPERIRKKHPDVEPKLLESYLARPLDEQPIWLNSGMSEGERKTVIGDFYKFAKNAKMAPPLRVSGGQADRAVKRQTRLTFKQWRVGRLTVQGLDIKEIAAQLQVSDRMVKTQLQAIRRKGKLTRNAQIVLWFLGF
jgi:DNA-binding CsgD family transcriptional regulator